MKFQVQTYPLLDFNFTSTIQTKSANIKMLTQTHTRISKKQFIIIICVNF